MTSHDDKAKNWLRFKKEVTYFWTCTNSLLTHSG